MSTQVPVCQSSQTALAALRSMCAHACRCIPVVDLCSVVGVVTVRDIVMAAARADARPSQLPLSQIMTDDVTIASPDMSIAEAEALMRARGLRRVPVVDGLHRPLGMLSLADIERVHQTHPPQATVDCDDDRRLVQSTTIRRCE